MCLCHNCDMLQLLLRVIKLDWLLGFTSGKKRPRRILQSLMYVSSCESLWPTWRGNELILGRQLLLGIFLQPWKINIVCLSPLFAILIISKIMRFLRRDYVGVCLGSGKKDPNYSMYLTFVYLLVYPFFLAGDLEFLGGGGPDTRNINSPSALAPNLHPAPMPSCHMIRYDMIRHGRIW